MLTAARLPGNLDDLLGSYQPYEATVERFPTRYDILFCQGEAKLLVSVYFKSLSFEVGGTPAVAARSLSDVYDGVALFGRVRAFLSAIHCIGVRDAREG